MSVKSKTFSSQWKGVLLTLPIVIITAIFLYYPMFDMFRISMTSQLFVGQGVEFVGLENYISLITSKAYLGSTLITFAFAFVVLTGSTALSLYISFLIYRSLRGAKVFLTSNIWPYALPPAVAGSILVFLLHPELGPITSALKLIGIPVDWKTNGLSAFFAVSMAAIWKTLGYNIIFLVAAFNNIPTSIDEVRKLDGVGDHKMLLFVYIPLITPTLYFLITINFIRAFFRSFAFVDIMTQGGPNGATNIMIYKLYRDTFQYGDIGSGAAQSVILFLLVGIATFIQMRYTSQFVEYDS